MKLKKLEIAGFKSFPDKTCIEFHPGVSAVVGPNGCGKSNIVDALRWVMGEQSVKQLRGKSMEDVIFAGSNGKPSLNMAEVSLTITNDNGDAPEELPEELRAFTEIILTRRLYRSGESVYSINKHACRLKDIHNIFLGSGMGAKSYAVIQQGNIGAITEARPEERRVFIEEAAGVTRYKNQKNEALRKIQSTKQNLLRVADIIAEVKRQMAGLKRQAKRAEIYKNHQYNIMQLDVLIALHYYDDYTRQIEKTDFLLKSLNDTKIEHTSKLKKLDAAVEEIKFQRSQKIQEISDQKARKFEHQRAIDKMENDLNHLRKDIKRLGNEAGELEVDRKNLEEKTQNILSEIAQVKNQNKSLKEEMQNVTYSLSRKRSASQESSDKLSELSRKIEAYKTNLMDMVAREARYKNIYQNAANNKESLKRHLTRIKEERAAASRKVISTQRLKSKAKSRLNSLIAEVGEINRRMDALQKRLVEKNNLLGKQVKLVQTLDLERNKARSQYLTLKKMEDNFEWYKDGVRAIMKAQDQTPGEQSSKTQENQHKLAANAIGLIADIIEPEPSFETAVEAVLGESLQYILVKDQEAGLCSINYLQSTSAGRSGFIPVSSIKQIDRKHEKMPDVQKRLINHISIRQGFEKIIEALLGHVVVASDIEEAITTYNNNGLLQTIVTKNGDIVSHQGIMIGGSKDNGIGILAKKQKLKELDRQMKRLDQQLITARNDQKELETEVRKIESNMQREIEHKNTVRQNEIEAEKSLYKITEDLKHARNHLEIVCLEQDQLLGEKSDIDEEIAKYNKELSEITNSVKTAQDKVAETSKKIDSASSEMENFNQSVIDLNLELTALNARLENSNNTLRRLEEFSDDGVKRLRQLSLELKQKNQNRQAFKQKIIEYEQSLSSMYDDMESLEQALESNETEYQSIAAKLQESDSIVSDMHSKREEVLQKIRMIELEQSQRHIKQETISNRLTELYHKPLTQLRPDSSERPEMPVDKMEDELAEYRKKIANIGDVNLGAIKEYEQIETRFDFLNKQHDDLVKALEDLQNVIKKINKITQERFINTFNLINAKLDEVFPRLFDGGSARLILTHPDKPLETGVELMIHPRGKKLTRISLLSGGEKALSAIAFIFSIFLIKPTSFCLMDEIDAPLDDSNILRFNDLLKVIGAKSQVIMITHNKRTMEFADMLFGVTMEKQGISKIVSVNLA
ncbi:MAG: chromosome segregation protein SMC [Desulfobacterales bacterium]|uniref:Chromosome partition protein Smc n=1 Tax=Candidatus Desulfaltia bathyphila TaxID=2841697 RepID=A0A8J6T7I8_9BACT|nr:chromosome segregation protein SMC [Candidatus Desulfaltia bathyphila]MBL7195230.1 chromosome segregation protein SMC [Desulfobacterales bacterium]MBL7207168.1 chromosome segregation protein SMC [Desulfobacterales bacterium]